MWLTQSKPEAGHDTHACNHCLKPLVVKGVHSLMPDLGCVLIDGGLAAFFAQDSTRGVVRREERGSVNELE